MWQAAEVQLPTGIEAPTDVNAFVSNAAYFAILHKFIANSEHAKAVMNELEFVGEVRQLRGVLRVVEVAEEPALFLERGRRRIYKSEFLARARDRLLAQWQRLRRRLFRARACRLTLAAAGQPSLGSAGHPSQRGACPCSRGWGATPLRRSWLLGFERRSMALTRPCVDET